MRITILISLFLFCLGLVLVVDAVNLGTHTNIASSSTASSVPSRRTNDDEVEDDDDEYRSGRVCNANSWKHCVNRSRQCHCYDRACRVRDTVEKEVLKEYNRVLLQRDYAAADLIFADDFVTEVPGFNIHIAGKLANVAYLTLADPNITDHVEILNSTFLTVVQEENVIMAHLLITLKNLIMGNVFDYNVAWVVTFDVNHRMQRLIILPDTLAVAVGGQGSIELNRTLVCQRIQAECVGDYQQYASQNDCETFMNTIPETPPSGFPTPQGNTVSCRSWHEHLARTLPEVHCLHTGPLNLGPDVTPCVD